jgi:hypothetical protein
MDPHQHLDQYRQLDADADVEYGDAHPDLHEQPDQYTHQYADQDPY